MTRSEMEARRLQAIPELTNGASVRALAKQFGVSRQSIYRWGSAVVNGESLKSRTAPGRPSRLTAPDLQKVRTLFHAGPQKAGFDLKRWTQAAFAHAIKEATKVDYHPDHVGRIMHRLGQPKRKKSQQQKAPVSGATDAPAREARS